MPTTCDEDLLGPGDRRHLDEVFLKINGRIHYLWRAVDQDGDVLNILVQTKRDKTAATKFFRKLLKGLRYMTRVIVTDKLKSYSAARAEVVPSVEHVQQKYQNNRAEGIVNLSENRWKRLPLVALRRHAYPTCGGGISEIIVKLTIPSAVLKLARLFVRRCRTAS
jgi:putative transposase